jgi:Tfp pilus assembly protein PilW
MKLRLKLTPQRGFTIVELVSAMAITMILSTAVVAVILGTLNSTGRSQLNAVVQTQVQIALNYFVINTRDAEKLYIADKNNIMFSFRNDNRCELHKYSFVPDEENLGSVALAHNVSSVFVPGTVSCSSVEEKLLSGSDSALTNNIDLKNLDPSSSFTFFSESTRSIVTPDSSGFNLSQQSPLCKITSVSINVRSYSKTKDVSNLIDNTMSVRLSNNALGLSC